MNQNKYTIHFIDDSPFGYISNGRDNWLYNISSVLSKHYSIHIHCTNNSNDSAFYDIKKLEQKGVRILRYNFTNNLNIIYRILNKLSFYILSHFRSFFFSLRVYHNLKKIINDQDIVFSLNPTFEALPGILLRKKNRNIIDICLMKGKPAYESTEMTPFLKNLFFALEKFFISHAQHLFSNAQDTREYVLEKYDKDTAIIKNGVDYNKFQKPEPEILNKEELLIKELGQNGMKLLLFVGTLHPRKGIEFIFDLPKYLDKIYKEKYAIIMVGKGRTDLYINRIKMNGLESKIFFMGEQKNIPFFYHNTDLSLHLTHSQLGMGGISHSTLEALASGSVIIAWDNRTYNQFLTSGTDSILIPEGNMEELASAVKTVLENKSLSSILKRNALKNAKNYDWYIIGDEIIAIINNMESH